MASLRIALQPTLSRVAGRRRVSGCWHDRRMSIHEATALLRSALGQVEPALAASANPIVQRTMVAVAELLDAGEPGVALEVLVSNLNEDDVGVPWTARRRLIEAARLMGMPIDGVQALTGRPMATGVDLLAVARSARPEEVVEFFGAGEGEGAHAAVVAALLSGYTDADAVLVRALTRLEMDRVAQADDGCGDVLLGCCWLLCMLGDVADSELIWRAKNLNFDAHCYIDSVFLVPQGVDATLEFAKARGLDDLAAWVGDGWLTEPEEELAAWRAGSFFRQAPPPTASVEELAAWIRS